MKETIKGVSLVLMLILSIVALISFCIAVKKGFDSKTVYESESEEIHVFINNNDSIVQQLQTDVNELTKIISSLQNDSVIVTVSKVKVLNPNVNR